jgi:sugar lactone lactonase YvrE
MKMNHGKLEVVTEHYCLLGEGPVWDNRQNRIFWIDILNGEIHSFYPDGNLHRICKLGEVLGAISLRKSGGLVAAMKDRFAAIDPDTGIMQTLAKVETHLPDNRFNDGKCDPAGRFWAGTMSVSNVPNAGSLYLLEKNLSVTTKIAGVSCSNGLAWSPDHQTLYYIDTPTQNVVAYAYDITNGNITDGRIVIRIPAGEGLPDGMTIDTEGMLWIALWGGWKVVRYNPFTGKQLHSVNLPVSRVTSCIFGGDMMEDLYITSARTGLSPSGLKSEPLAGALFVIKNSGFKGLDGFEFDG